MPTRIKLIATAFFVFAISISLHSQNFNYNLQKDSTAYTPIAGADVISAGQDFQSKSFVLHLPFSFNFCGTKTDSIKIEGNGFIVFDQVRGLAVIAFNSFSSNQDTAAKINSSILFQVTGTQGNRVATIEFNNLSQNILSENDYLNYQIKLYENGNKIIFHIGDNSYSNAAMSVMLGLINKNMDGSTNAFLISGNPSQPSGQQITSGMDFSNLNNVPSKDISYTLTPSIN
jgi:hypothetical protein